MISLYVGQNKVDLIITPLYIKKFNYRDASAALKMISVTRFLKYFSPYFMIGLLKFNKAKYTIKV